MTRDEAVTLLKVWLQRIAVSFFIALAIAFVVDYILLRFRNPQFGTVVVHRYYAVHLKDQKIEYLPDESDTETCVHSLFPHFGHNPCWYVIRHREQRIEINSGSLELPARRVRLRADLSGRSARP